MADVGKVSIDIVLVGIWETNLDEAVDVRVSRQQLEGHIEDLSAECQVIWQRASIPSRSTMALRACTHSALHPNMAATLIPEN